MVITAERPVTLGKKLVTLWSDTAPSTVPDLGFEICPGSVLETPSMRYTYGTDGTFHEMGGEPTHSDVLGQGLLGQMRIA